MVAHKGLRHHHLSGRPLGQTRDCGIWIERIFRARGNWLMPRLHHCALKMKGIRTIIKHRVVTGRLAGEPTIEVGKRDRKNWTYGTLPTDTTRSQTKSKSMSRHPGT